MKIKHEHIRMAMNAWAYPDGEKVPVSGQEKSLLAHEKETLEYKRQLAELGDKVEYQKRLNELAQQAVRFTVEHE